MLPENTTKADKRTNEQWLKELKTNYEKLGYQIDTRTPEQIAQDRLKEAQKMTAPRKI